MLPVVLRFVLGDLVVQCSCHVWQESVVVTKHCIRKLAAIVSHDMPEVDIEGGKAICAQAMDLCDVVLVGAQHTRSWST